MWTFVRARFFFIRNTIVTAKPLFGNHFIAYLNISSAGEFMWKTTNGKEKKNDTHEQQV